MSLCRYMLLGRQTCILNSSGMASAVAPLYLQYKLFNFAVPLALYDENSVQQRIDPEPSLSSMELTVLINNSFVSI